MKTIKKSIIISIIVVFISILVIPAALNADPVEKVDTFVCPVFNANSSAGDNNPNAKPIGGGDFTILPGKAAGDPGTHLNSPVSVPKHATNRNGQGTPGGTHSSPGDTDYTAIWNISG